MASNRITNSVVMVGLMKNSTKPTHGGKRKGAGKPAFFGSPMKRVNLMLDVATLAKFKKLGKGNISEGARQAALLIT